MTSAKCSDFWTLPCHVQKSADFVSFVCFLGTPFPHPLRTSYMEAPQARTEFFCLLPDPVSGREHGKCIGSESVTERRAPFLQRRIIYCVMQTDRQTQNADFAEQPLKRGSEMKEPSEKFTLSSLRRCSV